MVTTTNTAMTTGTEPGRGVHPRCVVCSHAQPGGLGLRFEPNPDGSVRARFDCAARHEGYPGMVHGGVISMLLDGAMTNCLFHHGRPSVTAEMRVRFRHPVALERHAVVEARIVERRGSVHRMAATLTQDGIIKATATAVFMARSTQPH